MDSIGDRLREIRGDRKQEDFAKLLGVSRKTWIRYESNERQPDVELIVKLNLLFNVQPLWLLTGVGESTGGERVTVDEKELLEHYRRLDASGKRTIRDLASRLGPEAAAHSVKQVFHAAVDQVAGRDIVNKRKK